MAHYVYYLRDPVTFEIRWVGETHDLDIRFASHSMNTNESSPTLHACPGWLKASQASYAGDLHSCY